MDALISWSKAQSKEMALTLRAWLPKVVPGFTPWMSSKDIDKGKQWFGELQNNLGTATSCIICVTKENVRSPWIYYETGAIAAKKDGVLICPYLVGVGASMIADGPLSQWQAALATKDETLDLVKSLNRALPKPHDESLLVGNFNDKWLEFEPELSRVQGMEAAAPADFVESEADVLAGYKLSAEARTLLVAAAQDSGDIMHVRYMGGTDIVAGGNTMNDSNDPRSIAIWERALKDLVSHGLVESLGYKNEVFKITARGYEVADLLKGKTVS